VFSFEFLQQNRLNINGSPFFLCPRKCLSNHLAETSWHYTWFHGQMIWTVIFKNIHTCDVTLEVC
jgi:hypothetical protein